MRKVYDCGKSHIALAALTFLYGCLKILYFFNSKQDFLFRILVVVAGFLVIVIVVLPLYNNLLENWNLEGNNLTKLKGKREIASFAVSEIDSIEPTSFIDPYVDPKLDWVEGRHSKDVLFHINGTACRMSKYIVNRGDLFRSICDIHEAAHGERRLDQALPPNYRKISPLEP